MEKENNNQKIKYSIDLLKEQNKQLLEKLKWLTLTYQTKVREHTFLALTSALGLVIGLSWKDLIDDLVKNYLISRIPSDSVLGGLITAVIITSVCVAILLLLCEFSKKGETNKNNKEIQAKLI